MIVMVGIIAANIYLGLTKAQGKCLVEVDIILSLFDELHNDAMQYLVCLSPCDR